MIVKGRRLKEIIVILLLLVAFQEPRGRAGNLARGSDIHIMYLKHSCGHCLTNYIVTENLNDSQRYNKGIKGKCQLLFFFSIFFEGMICIRDVEK